MNLVLLHGINNTSAAFNPVRAALPPDWHVLAPDLPALDRVEAIAEALLPQLPDRFILAGHSFGGYVALATLEKAPERIEALALIASSASADTDKAAAFRETRASEADQGAYFDLAEAATGLTFHPDSLADAALMAGRKLELEAYGAERYAAHQRACAHRPDRTDLLRRFQGPKLVVAAEEDAVIRVAGQREMAERVGAQYSEVARTGHMLIVERPEVVAEALAGWCVLELNSPSGP